MSCVCQDRRDRKRSSNYLVVFRLVFPSSVPRKKGKKCRGQNDVTSEGETEARRRCDNESHRISGRLKFLYFLRITFAYFPNKWLQRHHRKSQTCHTPIFFQLCLRLSVFPSKRLIVFSINFLTFISQIMYLPPTPFPIVCCFSCFAFHIQNILSRRKDKKLFLVR